MNPLHVVQLRTGVSEPPHTNVARIDSNRSPMDLKYMGPGIILVSVFSSTDEAFVVLVIAIVSDFSLHEICKSQVICVLVGLHLPLIPPK